MQQQAAAAQMAAPVGDHAASFSLFFTGTDDIYVEDSWRPATGDPMPHLPGCRIGRMFGAGALALNQIFDLVDGDGKSIGQALKVCKPTLAARRSLAHEWKMFKDLALLGESQPAARSHFLQAHRVLRLSNDVIVGIIMEKADGQNVIKTLKRPDFCNVRYVVALLRDVLAALDVAQRVLGFSHYDLKLDNIMEHWGCAEDVATSKSRVCLDAVPQFKLFDFGTAVVYPDPFSVKLQPLQPATSSASPAPEQAPAPAAAAELRQAKAAGTDKPGVVSNPHRATDLYFSQPFCCVRIYQLFWRSRGDVYRVLVALARLADGRVWPVEDLECVSLLLTVLEHATAARRLRARFVPKARLMRKLGIQGPPQPQAAAAGCTQQQQAAAAAATAQGSASRAPAEVAAPASPFSSSLYQPAATAHGGRGSSGDAGPAAATATAAAVGAAGSTSASGLPSTPRSSLHVPRSSMDERSSERSQVPGVAFARLSPVAPPPAQRLPPAPAAASAAAPAAAKQSLAAAVPAAVPAGVPRADMSGSSGGAAELAGAASLQEGCAVDPAARLVAQQPLAAVADQSVFGSRKAVRGVTAAQLLAEPVVQSLLRKLAA